MPYFKMYNFSAEQSYVAPAAKKSDRPRMDGLDCTGERTREKHTGERTTN